MNEHVPECELLEPCSAEIPEHGYPLSIYCIHCERTCICDALRACEQRVLGERIQKLLIAEDVRGFIEYGYEMGYEVAKAKYKKGKK